MRTGTALTLILPLLLGGCGDLIVEPDDQGTARPADSGYHPPGAHIAATPLPPASRPPPPIAAAPVAPPSPAEAQAGEVAVRAGQTLYAVSREQNVPVRALIDANNLQPPYTVRVGQVLAVPRQHQYIVQQGDTLYSIGRRNGVEAATLARLNHLDPPYIVKAGLERGRHHGPK